MTLYAAFEVQREEWMAEGACKGEDPELFILAQGYTAEKASQFCKRCPVTQECAAYARRTGSVGVWGGKLFTFRYTEPTELLPVQVMQDARPHNVAAIRVRSNLPSILGAAASFRHPGILG